MGSLFYYLLSLLLFLLSEIIIFYQWIKCKRLSACSDVDTVYLSFFSPFDKTDRGLTRKWEESCVLVQAMWHDRLIVPVSGGIGKLGFMCVCVCTIRQHDSWLVYYSVYNTEIDKRWRNQRWGYRNFRLNKVKLLKVILWYDQGEWVYWENKSNWRRLHKQREISIVLR